MTSDAVPKPRPAMAIVVCLLIPVLLGVVLRWPRPSPPPLLGTLLETGRLNPQQPSPTSTASSSPVGAPRTGVPGTGPGPEQPWWASLTPSEAALRQEDFEYMYNLPGAYPEFSEIIRQLTDAGVPIQIVRFESREIFGALYTRHQNLTMSGELHGMANQDESETMGEVTRVAARFFGDKAAVAETEVKARLIRNGVALDSTAAQRILQLAPENPIRHLGPRADSVVKPEDEPALESPTESDPDLMTAPDHR